MDKTCKMSSYAERILAAFEKGPNGPYTAVRLNQLDPTVYQENKILASICCGALMYFEGDKAKYQEFCNYSCDPIVYKIMFEELFNVTTRYQLHPEHHVNAIIDLTLIKLVSKPEVKDMGVHFQKVLLCIMFSVFAALCSILKD